MLFQKQQVAVIDRSASTIQLLMFFINYSSQSVSGDTALTIYR